MLAVRMLRSDNRRQVSYRRGAGQHAEARFPPPIRRGSPDDATSIAQLG
jgi:hypothetical protein